MSSLLQTAQIIDIPSLSSAFSHSGQPLISYVIAFDRPLSKDPTKVARYTKVLCVAGMLKRKLARTKINWKRG